MSLSEAFVSTGAWANSLTCSFPVCLPCLYLRAMDAEPPLLLLPLLPRRKRKPLTKARTRTTKVRTTSPSTTTSSPVSKPTPARTRRRPPPLRCRMRSPLAGGARGRGGRGSTTPSWRRSRVERTMRVSSTFFFLCLFRGSRNADGWRWVRRRVELAQRSRLRRKRSEGFSEIILSLSVSALCSCQIDYCCDTCSAESIVLPKVAAVCLCRPKRNRKSRVHHLPLLYYLIKPRTSLSKG